jgi:hypothetical protein
MPYNPQPVGGGVCKQRLHRKITWMSLVNNKNEYWTRPYNKDRISDKQYLPPVLPFVVERSISV